MERFSALEAKALGLYNLPENTPTEKYLTEIQDVGIYYWNESIKLIEGLDSLDLPQALKTRNSQLKEYCEVRIKSYELIYKAINEETDRYEEEINAYYSKIESIISALGGGE
jgi:rhomboid protease GluP